MGLIINQKIPAYKVGFPTVSDKYDVEGGLAGEDIDFGAVLTVDANKKYKVATTGKIDGIALGTNVKLTTSYPGGDSAPYYVMNEALNVLIRGRVAVELDSGADAADIVKNSYAYYKTSTGLLTTDDSETEITGIVQIVFTGHYEVINEGTDDEYIIAEVEVK